MKTFYFTMFFCCYALLTQAQTEKRIALLIGNANYAGDAQLKNPVNDANALATALKNYGFDVVIKINLNLVGMETAIGEFSNKIVALRKNGSIHVTALFYFSGHGLQIDGENYFVPINENIVSAADVKRKTYPNAGILANVAPADMQIVLIDACRNNPFTKSWFKDLPNISEQQGLLSPTMSSETKTKIFNNLPHGTFISFAAAPGSKALDGTGTNSPYVESILAAYQTNETSSLGDLFGQVKTNVFNKTSSQQRAWINDNVINTFYFKKPESAAQAEAQRKAALIAEQKRNADAAAESARLAEEKLKKDLPTEKFINNAKLLLVKGGTFQMGSTDGEPDEKPVHSVTVSDFFMSQTEVTNEQYASFLNAYKSNTVKEGEFSGQLMIYDSKTEYSGSYNWGLNKVDGVWRVVSGYEKFPVIYVTWYGANEYCKFYKGRLPTEAEWEFAARGGNAKGGMGNDSPFAKGGRGDFKYAGSDDLNSVAWYSGNSESKTHPVGKRAANELGLYDMSGNVWEWCADFYDKDFYKSAEATEKNPINKNRANVTVLRGGSWGSNNYFSRVAYRSMYVPAYRNYYYGFRLVL